MTAKKPKIDAITTSGDTDAHATLTRIAEVLASPALSLQGKVAFAHVTAHLWIHSPAIWTIVTPSDDFAAGLYELARHGLIRLEVSGQEYCVRHVSHLSG